MIFAYFRLPMDSGLPTFVPCRYHWNVTGEVNEIDKRHGTFEALRKGYTFNMGFSKQRCSKITGNVHCDTVDVLLQACRYLNLCSKTWKQQMRQPILDRRSFHWPLIGRQRVLLLTVSDTVEREQTGSDSETLRDRVHQIWHFLRFWSLLKSGYMVDSRAMLTPTLTHCLTPVTWRMVDVSSVDNRCWWGEHTN